ncbi:unnamed protein product [Hymenolepis diminuta]|uniref:Uncharacterized protein n=1 Tax=Hymenolepis diminuta TaxID=6216 RepID=A0A564YBD7_HYMDI|nr:unnamed protein product [Hymenolepis diminuta]
MVSIGTVKIVAIVGSIVEQMNLSKPAKDREDYIKSVSEFHYEPSASETFTTCKSDHDLYLAYRLPLSPKDLIFAETIEKCEKVFFDDTSLCNRRFRCLSLPIREGGDIHKYTGIDLCSPCYAEIRLKLWSPLDKNPDIMLYYLVDEYNNFRSLVADSNMVESNETRACQINNPEFDQSPENNPDAAASNTAHVSQ